MPSYHFHLHKDGEAADQMQRELASDFEAYSTAEKLSSNFNVEVSRGGRFVALIRKRPPTTVPAGSASLVRSG